MAVEYKPEDILIPRSLPIDKKFAVIILDRPIAIPIKIMMSIWNSASFRVAVGSGVDNWMRYLKSNEISEEVKRIDVITGDIEDISEENLNLAQNNGIKIIPKSGNEMDLNQSLVELFKLSVADGINLDLIYVIQQTSGRIDRILGNLNVLLSKVSDENFKETQIFLVSHDNLTWIVNAGKSLIHIPDVLQNKKGICCGVLPIGKRCESMVTSGLNWDLNGEAMEFGGIMSACNFYNGSKTVSIDTKTPAVWTMDIGPIVDGIMSV